MEIPENNTTNNNIQQKPESSAKTVIVTILVMIGAFIAIGAWYNNTHYNSTFQNNFLSSCQSNGGSASSCSCVYSTLQQHYSYSTAKYVDANPNASDSQAIMTWVANQCTGSSQGQ